MTEQPQIIRKGTILYHGSLLGTPEDFEHGIEPSGDDVTAAASGAWVSPAFHEAEDYGRGNTMHFVANRDLIMHPAPSEDSELGKIRKANQLVNEERNNGEPLDEEDIKEYGYEGVDRSKAADISGILEDQGYHGHWDPFMGAHEMVVYNPDHLTFVGHTDSSRKFHPALGAQWSGN